ncbi:MAG: hypothetical protein ACKOXK_08625 [Chakrabartia sp.]
MDKYQNNKPQNHKIYIIRCLLAFNFYLGLTENDIGEGRFTHFLWPCSDEVDASIAGRKSLAHA